MWDVGKEDMQRVCVTEGDARDEGKMMLSGRFGVTIQKQKKDKTKEKVQALVTREETWNK